MELFTSADYLKKLGEELIWRRDGQVVFGRRMNSADFAKMTPKQVEKFAIDSFTPLAGLFNLHGARSRVAANG